jgi:hypothetical protein
LKRGRWLFYYLARGNGGLVCVCNVQYFLPCKKIAWEIFSENCPRACWFMDVCSLLSFRLRPSFSHLCCCIFFFLNYSLQLLLGLKVLGEKCRLSVSTKSRKLALEYLLEKRISAEEWTSSADGQYSQHFVRASRLRFCGKDLKSFGWADEKLNASFRWGVWNMIRVGRLSHGTFLLAFSCLVSLSKKALDYGQKEEFLVCELTGVFFFFWQMLGLDCLVQKEWKPVFLFNLVVRTRRSL